MATLLNALSVAVVVAAFVQPFSAGRYVDWRSAIAAALFVVLQFGVHYILTRLED